MKWAKDLQWQVPGEAETSHDDTMMMVKAKMGAFVNLSLMSGVRRKEGWLPAVDATKALAEACKTDPPLRMDAILRAIGRNRHENWEFQVLRVWADGENRWCSRQNQTKWWFVKRYALTREHIAERKAESTKRWGASDPRYKKFGIGTGDRGLNDVCKRWKDGKGAAYYGGAAGSGAAQSSS